MTARKKVATGLSVVLRNPDDFDTDRYFLCVFQCVLEWLVLLLEDLNGILESLREEKTKKDDIRLVWKSS